MIILGIDPGSEVTGYGVIESAGSRQRALGWGVVKAKAGLGFPARLRAIHDQLTQFVQLYRPDSVSIEDIFYAVNVRSTLKLGHTRGAILLSMELAGVPSFSYTPLEIKKALVGYGRASKEQVRDMVCLLLNLKGADLPVDASDALAAALCHAQIFGTRMKIQARRDGR